jgi:uncharacterized protein YndB with AHSA1/START domain
MVEVSEQVSAVQRRVGSRVLEAGEARVVTISQVYPTDVDDLWDACTNPERIPRWFLPVKGELKLGGHYQLEGNAGGTVERCDPPTGFDATWEFGGGVSWIEVRLSPEGDGARFQLEHIAHVDDHWREYGPGAVGIGWDLAFRGLAKHITTGAALDPKAEIDWMSTPEGTRFMQLSSAAWCAADIAGGADEAEAKAAADRTTAAYTAGSDPA